MPRTSTFPSIYDSTEELRKVAALVKKTQPVWSTHLTNVCDYLDMMESRLADYDYYATNSD